MTKPIDPLVLQFTFHGIVYDATIIPLLNGAQAPVTEKQMEIMRKAEHVYKQKIEEMIVAAAPDYSLATHGLLISGSSEGFTFEKTPIAAHKPIRLWQEFVESLRHPGVAAKKAVGPDTKIAAKPNPYLNLSQEERKEVRLELFKKKAKEAVLGEKVSYTEPELAYFAMLHPRRNKVLPGQERFAEVLLLDLAEKEAREEMHDFYRRLVESKPAG